MVVVGAVFIAISWQVALFAVLPIPLIVWGSFRYQRSLEPRYAEVRRAAGAMNALLENDLSGMSTIQSFTAEDREIKRVEALSNVYRESNRQAIRSLCRLYAADSNGDSVRIHSNTPAWGLDDP